MPFETRGYPYRARAIRNHDAHPHSPDELSFSKNEILEVHPITFDTRWKARQQNGKEGFIPRNYVVLLIEDEPTEREEQSIKSEEELTESEEDAIITDPIPQTPLEFPYRARAIYSYDHNPDVPDQLSFSKDDEFEVETMESKWWPARMSNGITGTIPNEWVRLLGKKKSRSSPIPSSLFSYRHSSYRYRIKALFSYDADPNDDNALSFCKNELLGGSDISGRWWRVRKENGEKGLVPSEWLMLLSEQEDNAGEEATQAPAMDTDVYAYRYRIKAFFSYEADPNDSSEISFSKDDILGGSHIRGEWWRVRKKNGEKGLIPSSHVYIEDHD